MLNKRQYENDNQKVYKLYFPSNSFAQMKSGEDVHFMSNKDTSKDDFIEVDDEGLEMLLQQITDKLCDRQMGGK
ncbi:hypothetical protein ACQW5G_00600 [Fructilactobacillus sp. Tb1]|uniref:hypothetical protein n=1 Tax=Fructilactobacillus sp. Tb1 TaxID=3422304 RepID=UPI003D27F949